MSVLDGEMIKSSSLILREIHWPSIFIITCFIKKPAIIYIMVVLSDNYVLFEKCKCI